MAKDKEAPLKEALAKKGGLTLSQLAQYDDLSTDVLVDKVYFWATIRKNRTRYSPLRSIHDEDIARILRESVAFGKDPARAQDQLLELAGLKRYLARLPTKDEKEHFKRHFRKYINMYMPDCPWEVSTTNRYTITQHEAAVCARRDIGKNEVIKYLCGIQVAMTKEEEERLDLNKRDFSIVMSSRKKAPSLFLGPARFANHDCDPNARLTTNGPNGMAIVSKKDIDVGDEITVSYGEDYFGEDNCECLCATCERLVRNGWGTVRKGADGDADDSGSQAPPPDGPYSFRKKRRYATESATASRDTTTEPVAREGRKKMADTPLRSHTSSPGSGKRKAAELEEQPRPTSSGLEGQKRLKVSDGTHIKMERTESQQSQDTSRPSEPELGPMTTAMARLRSIRSHQRDRLFATAIAESESASASSPGSFSDASQHSSHSTTATSVDEDISAIPSSDGTDAPIKTEIEIEQVPAIEITVDSTEAQTAAPAATNTLANEPPEESELSELSDSVAFDDDNQQLIRQKDVGTQPGIQHNMTASSSVAAATPIPTIENPPGPSPADDVEEEEEEEGDDEDEDGLRRYPGDYTLTPLLLCAKYSRWVSCRTCDADFVQEEAYLTRAACPRCERHSKLYGFAWPKTDREGKHDRERRVTDHREIDRFVSPGEERELRRGKKKWERERQEQLRLQRTMSVGESGGGNGRSESVAEGSATPPSSSLGVKRGLRKRSSRLSMAV